MAVEGSLMDDSSRVEVSQLYQRLKDVDEEEKSNRPSTTRGLTYPKALIAIVKVCVGIGLLSLPNAFYQSGLTTGIVLAFFIAFINVHGMHILVTSNRTLCNRFNKASLSYSETLEFAILSISRTHSRLASFGNLFVNVFVCIAQLGICSGYFVFISANLKQVIDFYQGPTGATWSESTYISFILPAILLLNIFRRLDCFTPFVLVANICYLLGLLIILAYLCQHIGTVQVQLDQFHSWKTLPLYFGTFMFSFEFVSMVLPIMNDMHNPNDFNRGLGVLNVGSSIVFVFYLLLGSLGYVAFGNGVLDSIPLNMPIDQALYQSVKLLLAVAIFFSYGIQFYAVAEIVTSKLQSSRFKLANSVGFATLEYGIKAVLILITFGMAQLIPHLSLMISLVGSVALTVLGLLIPAAIETLTLGPSGWGRHRWILWKNVLISLYGIFILISGVYASVRDIVAAG